jgi:hypothetical protein
VDPVETEAGGSDLGWFTTVSNTTPSFVFPIKEQKYPKNHFQQSKQEGDEKEEEICTR